MTNPLHAAACDAIEALIATTENLLLRHGKRLSHIDYMSRWRTVQTAKQALATLRGERILPLNEVEV